MCSKQGYVNQEKARIALKAVRARRNAGTREKSIYLCSACSQWHLTSQGRRG